MRGSAIGRAVEETAGNDLVAQCSYGAPAHERYERPRPVRGTL